MNSSNSAVSKLLRSVGAALSIKKANLFQVRAYENAADSIEHLTSEVKDLWQEGKLGDIPGVGKSLQEYLDEYFKTGTVGHFEGLKKGIKPQVFEFLDITGVGPKTAVELADLGVEDLKDLENKIKSGELIEKGFSEKISQKILLGLSELSGRSGRMLLPFASAQAEKILNYLKKGPGVVAADPMGSLRRQVATIGDLDFVAASRKPKEVIDYFVKMPGIARILDQGENKANVIMDSGLEVDLLVGVPESYGALLQHFTGGKNHNIKLRTLALKKGFSLSEYGVKRVASGKSPESSEEVIATKTEEELYKMLGMETPEPELREDNGEIEAALAHKLPKLIEAKDIKGDFHLHSNFPMINPSHGPGVNPIKEIVKKAEAMGYKYVGISDHPPAFRSIPQEKMLKILENRNKEIEHILYSSKISVLNGLEIDILPDGTLSVPNKFLQTLDYVIAGIHSGHRNEKGKITERLLKALSNPNVDIIWHPTGRILNERESYDADWEEVFKFCAANNKLLEINAHYERLDLRDDLVRLALKLGCQFIIDSDAHEVSQMENIPFGVSVARRGWLEAKDVVNTWEWKKVAEWFNIKR